MQGNESMNFGHMMPQIAKLSEHFLQKHAVRNGKGLNDTEPISGEFALHRGQSSYDLYGMLDSAYVLYTINRLKDKTDRASREIWAQRILSCQDEQGWFSKLNYRGHSREHATAYVVGALRLLEVEPEETYVTRIKPPIALLPILTSHRHFLHWIEHLNFRFTPRDILNKNLGWHHIWRGSHIGGGVAAIIEMVSHLLTRWWSEKVNSEQWFNWYFNWLDMHANAESGYWQRAFWNVIYRKPTIIDMGGAVHFLWIYEAMSRPFPYPEPVILSTLQLQRQDGLYKDHPFCIDLDGNFCIVRSYLQLPKSQQSAYTKKVHQSLEASFQGIVSHLTRKPFEEIYSDSHGLPGALAALVECAKLPDFKYADSLKAFQHPLDRVCWL
jgi:hypothetical protein